MNIATALNKKYLYYTVVMLTSLCENNNVHIDAYLLSSDLSGEDISLMEDALKKYDISIHPLKVDRALFSDKLPRNEMWSIETYFRLLLMDLLPQSVNKLLYLDVDMVINKSLDELWDVDMGEDEIIACIDSCGATSWEQRSEKQREMFAGMIEQGYEYFNAGVMLMNVEKIRKSYNFEKYMDAVREWNYEMSAPDQDILNFCHWKNVGYVDPWIYDMFARIAHNNKLSYEEVKDQVAVIHYAGDKPWKTTNVHYEIEKLWWDYARLTPFYAELLEDFLESTMRDTTAEDYMLGLIEDNKRLKAELNKCLEAIKTMIN